MFVSCIAIPRSIAKYFASFPLMSNASTIISPTIPGSEGIIETFDKAKKIAKKIGYPVMIKATAGGGGKGMRAVWNEESFLDLWQSARCVCL